MYTLLEPALVLKPIIHVISLQLGRHEDALDFAVASHSLAPLKSEVAERVENVKKDIALGMSMKFFGLPLLSKELCDPLRSLNMIYIFLMLTKDIIEYLTVTSFHNCLKLDTEKFYLPNIALYNWKLYTIFFTILVYLTAEAEKNSKANDGASRSDIRGGRILSLSDILYRPEANGDVPQDGSRSDRDDSDYDEELELDFETSISGDEAQDLDSNILHGSLNVRIHRRGDSRDNAGASGPSDSPSSSSQSSRTCYLVYISTFKYNHCWWFLITMIQK